MTGLGYSRAAAKLTLWPYALFDQVISRNDASRRAHFDDAPAYQSSVKSLPGTLRANRDRSNISV